MKRKNIFYSLFVLTILAIRFEVFIFPANRIIIDGLRINHFWIGVAVALVALFLLKSYKALKMIIFPLGLGLVADELTFMIFSHRTIADYWSVYSIAGVVIIMIVVFIFREKLLSKIYN